MIRNDTTALLRQLSEKLGLPLPDLVANGLLPDQIAAQMDKNCAACPDPAKCADFLADRPDRIEKPPAFCVNGRLLTFLSKTLPKTP
ncbi:DUF6455 family protein [Pseudorhodobacter ferrugineus]|uniref:DUF6455 family protein n=1 Tax=Pseudorhodobacter ferrugineus TaxID=77008 RepID=UPI000AC1E402|nr:DUF6455 family protein [Pseudorhodobacter ferrugineus]